MAGLERSGRQRAAVANRHDARLALGDGDQNRDQIRGDLVFEGRIGPLLRRVRHLVSTPNPSLDLPAKLPECPDQRLSSVRFYGASISPAKRTAGFPLWRPPGISTTESTQRCFIATYSDSACLPK